MTGIRTNDLGFLSIILQGHSLLGRRAIDLAVHVFRRSFLEHSRCRTMPVFSLFATASNCCHQTQSTNLVSLSPFVTLCRDANSKTLSRSTIPKLKKNKTQSRSDFGKTGSRFFDRCSAFNFAGLIAAVTSTQNHLIRTQHRRRRRQHRTWISRAPPF